MFQRVEANPKTPLNNPRRPSIVNYYYWCYREEGPMSSSSYQIHVHKIYTPPEDSMYLLALLARAGRVMER